MASWNDVRQKEKSPEGKLAVEILDCWIEYLRDEDWWFGPDERHNMTDDIMWFRHRLTEIEFPN